MLSRFNGFQHFVVSFANGRLLISPAKEVVPHKFYEIVRKSEPVVTGGWVARDVFSLRLQTNLVKMGELKSEMS